MLIIFSINSNSTGISLFWNDTDLIIEPYDRQDKVYYCGNKLQKFETKKSIMYTIICLSLDECYIGNVYSDRSIEKLWNDTSNVPKKHKAGGQSAQRFSRQRQNEIIQWYKEVSSHIPNQEFILSMSKIYYKRFNKYMSHEQLNNITHQLPLESNGITGIYETLNRLSN